MTLHHLILAVEKATAPSRAIDGDVVEHFGLQPPGMKRAGGPQPELFRERDPRQARDFLHTKTWLAPPMTKSLDAAEAMIPHGWRLGSLCDWSGPVRTRCILQHADKRTVIGYGCNRATAMLAAGLRAKAADRGENIPVSDCYDVESHAVVDPILPESMIAA